MPEERLRIPFDDREVDAVRVHVQSQQEPFSTYLLEDGSTLKVKTVVTDVLRLEGEYDTNGDPIYAIKATTVTDVQATRKLKGKAP